MDDLMPTSPEMDKADAAVAEPPASMLGYTAKIATELEPFRRPLTDFQPHPENVRKHKIEKIAQSLEAHGQRALIIVQASTGYIVKGNGTYTAMQMLGWQEAAFSIQDMTDELAMAFLYADNRASDFATYDRKKLREGLAKMAAGPGLFDSLWDITEFEDLDEELNGATIMDPQETGASFATGDGASLKDTKEKKLPGEKMREVPLVLTIADHAMFVERIRILMKRFGTGGTIATIMEAVRRQAEAESASTVPTGKALTVEAEHAAKRAVVTEIRDYILTMGPDRNYTGTWLVAQLERIVPYRPEPKAVAEGQVGAFEELVGEPLAEALVDAAESAVEAAGSVEAVEANPAVAEAMAAVEAVLDPPRESDGSEVPTPGVNLQPDDDPANVDPEKAAAYAAEQAEALARYRQSQS